MSETWNREVISGFKDMRSEMGVWFTVNGGATQYLGILHRGPELLTLGLGGFTQDWNRALQFLPAEITITNGDKVTIKGSTYRAVKPDTGDDYPVTTIGLIGVNK